MGLTDRAKRVALIGLGAIALVGLVVWLLWSAPQRPPETKPQTAVPPAPTARSLDTPPAPATDEKSPVVSVPMSAPAENAAAVYRKAFALLDALPKEDKVALGDWRAQIDADRSAQLCENVRPVLDLMHHAATLTNCDWDIGPLTPETMHTVVLPQIEQCRTLARAVMWSAGHCRTDNPAGTVDDLLANLQLGHNLPQSALLGFQVETGFQRMTVSFVAENASSFGGSERDRLIKMFTDAKYEDDFYHAIEQEADFANRLAQTNKYYGKYPELTRQVADLEREYAKALAGTEDQYHAWLNRMRTAQDSNVVLKMLWPIIEDAADKARAAVVQRTMVAAGLTVFQDGPEALSSYPDPATGQPFEYRETADGFQLQSAFQRDGQSVTMEIRR